MSVDESFVVLGLTLAAQRWNAGAAVPVIALHGWLDNSESFTGMAAFMPDVDLVALDLAGHGWSGHRPLNGNYLIWDDLREILAVADILGWKRFAVLGHSRGAIVGALLAAACPDRVSALGLVDGLWAQTRTEDKAPSQLARALQFPAGGSQPVFTSLAEMVALRIRSGFPLSEAAAEALVSRNAIETAVGWCWRSDPRLKAPSLVMLTPGQEQAFHQAVRCRVELVLAEHGLVMAYPDYPARLERLPAIEWSVCPGGHHLHMENAAEALGQRFNRFFASAHSDG